jgi:hypothetical protein
VNPIQLTRTLDNALVEYLTTIFDVNRDGQEPELASAIRAAISAPSALFNGPYLEIAPPYQTGNSLESLCREGVLSSTLASLQCFRKNRPLPLSAPLYKHQEKAIRKLSLEKRSIVVSSGTGSGKTECFLIPILNDLLIDPSPGVRAILIYPLNALVNDQLERLRVLLSGTDITFGRYTSELAETRKQALQRAEDDPLDNEVICREEIRTGEKLPQILITNYAMLEYLLLRPEDSKLFEQGRWRFLVLDEAHTYSGAQGIEVAMLIRRLKHRLNKAPGDVRCIATSATLTNNDSSKAVQFAKSLFDESFDDDDVIFGEVEENYVPDAIGNHDVNPECYLDARFPELLSQLREEETVDTQALAQKMLEMQILPPDVLEHAKGNVQTFLFKALLDNRQLTVLRQWMMARRDSPAHVSEAAKVVFGELDEQARLQALYHSIELGAMARPAKDETSLLPARYHVFARPPQGIWVCLNPACEGRTTSSEAGWSRMYSERREICDGCGCRVYPLVVCRECGQVYVRMSWENQQFSIPPDDLYGDENIRYFTWKPIDANRALTDVEIESETARSTHDDDTRFKQDEQTLCLSCGYIASQCECDVKAHVTLYSVNALSKDARKGNRIEPIEQMNQCCRCFSKSIGGTEIVTTVSVGGITPLSILTYELYRQLPPAANELVRQQPGEGRKLPLFMITGRALHDSQPFYRTW